MEQLKIKADEQRLQKFMELLRKHFENNLEEISLLGGYLAVLLKDKFGNEQALCASILDANENLREDFDQHVLRTLVAGLLFYCGTPDSTKEVVQV